MVLEHQRSRGFGVHLPTIPLRSALLVVAAGCALGSASPTRAQDPGTEIGELLEAVGKSECRFIRNGESFSGPDAREHMAQKFRYLRSRGVKTAEDFIQHAGTSSSVSHRPYEVSCPGAPLEPSAAWLRRQLQNIRNAGRSK